MTPSRFVVVVFIVVVYGDDKEVILKTHNSFRANVKPGPPSKPIPKLTWNDKLEKAATEWSKKCNFEHAANVDKKFVEKTVGIKGWVGENLYMATSGSSDWKAGITAWNSEVKDYDYCSNSCSAVCGHYTQVVWAGTTSVGCGKTDCKTGAAKGNDYFVCFYFPGGNIAINVDKPPPPYDISPETRKKVCGGKNGEKGSGEDKGDVGDGEGGGEEGSGEDGEGGQSEEGSGAQKLFSTMTYPISLVAVSIFAFFRVARVF